MKKINMLKLLAVLATISVITGCGNDCKNEVHLYLPHDFKDCFVFPAGSWWVYSVNGEVYDTLKIESSTLKPRIEPANNECEFIENFSSSYSTNHYSYFDNYNFRINYKKSPTHNEDTVYYSFIKPEWYKYSAGFPSAFIFVKYFGAGLFGLNESSEMNVSEQIEKGGGYWIENLKDTIINSQTQRLIIFRTVNFEILDDVLKNDVDNLPPLKVYYARGIGLIKKEMYNGDIWTLEDYFINE